MAIKKLCRFLARCPLNMHERSDGLLLYGRESIQAKAETAATKLGFGSVLQKMKSWFQVNF